MQFTLRSLSALAALAVVPVLPSSRIAAPPLDGYIVTYQMSGMGDGNAPGSITMKFAGDKMRLEFDMSAMIGGGGARGGMDMGPMMAGAFMLVQGGGKMAMVLPGMRMAMSMDLGALAARGGRGGATAACPAAPTIDDLGAGESIAGHPTHKYRVHTKNGTADETSDVWLATDMAGVDDAFMRMGESMGSNGGAAKCVGDALKGKMVKGFVLKVTGGSGAKAMTMEATRAEKMNIDASEFEVPPGIQMMDASMMMGGRGRGGE